MKVQIAIEIKPFSVPNFVVQEEKRDGNERPSIPLTDIDAVTLSNLCDQFRRDVFKKAGKSEPPKPACHCR